MEALTVGGRPMRRYVVTFADGVRIELSGLDAEHGLQRARRHQGIDAAVVRVETLDEYQAREARELAADLAAIGAEVVGCVTL